MPSAPQPPPASTYPREGTPREKWEFLLRYAVRAPSSHNSQPWRFAVAEDGRLRLYADRTRALPVVDPEDRELVISCGAALAHLRVAVRHSGHAGDVAPFPDPTDPDLLATIGFGRPRTPRVDDLRLFEAIDKRGTHRAAFDSGTVPRQVLARICRLDPDGPVTEVQVFTGPEKAALAALVGEGDRIQFHDADFRRELAAWLRPNNTRRLDGMRGDALGIGDLTSLLVPSIVAKVDTGASQARRDEQLALAAPALVLLSTPGDSPPDWLAAGQAMAVLLLRAAAHGLAASFLNQPIEVPPLRDRLRRLAGGGRPQLLLRVGYATTDRPSLRRPVTEVLGD